MILNPNTWKDQLEGGNIVGFRVVVVDDSGNDIEVEGIISFESSHREVILKNVGGERKFNTLQFKEKYKGYVSLIENRILVMDNLLETHLKLIKDHVFRKLGCHISSAPEYYNTAIINDFILSKNELDGAFEILNSQGALYSLIYSNHPFKKTIDDFIHAYDLDLRKVNKVLNKEIIRDLSPQYLARLELLYVGEILDEAKMELLPLKLITAPITIEENKGTLIPFELFISKYLNMANKLGIAIANKIFKKREYPSTVDKFFSSKVDINKAPTIDKSVLAQTHLILKIIIQGIDESLENVNTVFTNIQKMTSKERVVTFPTPTNSELDSALVYAIASIEEFKGRPLKHIEHTHFTNKGKKAA